MPLKKMIINRMKKKKTENIDIQKDIKLGEEALVSNIYLPQRLKEQLLPMYLESVSAGFPSPADDYLEGKIDLNEYLIHNPAATFFVRVTGDSMNTAGIFSGDILIVDRSLHAKDNNIVVAAVNGELLVKRLSLKDSKLFLVAENKAYQPIEVTEQMNFEVWGVVSSVIHFIK
jgi:DNA polymerase V